MNQALWPHRCRATDRGAGDPAQRDAWRAALWRTRAPDSARTVCESVRRGAIGESIGRRLSSAGI